MADPDGDADNGTLSGFIDAPLSASAKKLRASPELIAAYDKASTEVLQKFLAKNLFAASGDLVTDLNAAHALADVAGRSAAQAIQKVPKVAGARVLYPEGKHPLDLQPLKPPTFDTAPPAS